MEQNKTPDGYFYGDTAPIEEMETVTFAQITEQQAEDYYEGRMSSDEYNYLNSLPEDKRTREDNERLVKYHRNIRKVDVKL